MNSAIQAFGRSYPFCEDDARRAFDEWGCNCGPAALAFALGKPLDYVRPVIPQFCDRRYTSPTMMAAALDSLNVRRVILGQPKNRDRDCLFAEDIALVRVQWTGPWIQNGVAQKWASRQTHWVATWQHNARQWVFDINGGIRDFASWQTEIVPLIVAEVKRADGGWWPASVWRLTTRAAAIEFGKGEG